MGGGFLYTTGAEAEHFAANFSKIEYHHCIKIGLPGPYVGDDARRPILRLKPMCAQSTRLSSAQRHREAPLFYSEHPKNSASLKHALGSA